MRLIFFGTSDFAVPSLRKILQSRYNLAAVVTQPDRKKGRELILAPPPVKREIEGKAIPIHQPQDVSKSDTISILRGYNADIFVVVDFGQILKPEVLKIPRLYCVNLHASLLPKYRGAAPINWAIINGEVVTGLTAIKMNEKMDRGDIILRRECKILDDDTSQTLRERLSETGAVFLTETLELIEKGREGFTRQDERAATYAYKLKKSDGLIDWSMDGRDINNRVRGLIPWPGAYTRWKGKFLKIWKSGFNQNAHEEKEIGSVLRLEDNGIVVGTGKGELVIRSLQLGGGRRLNADEFLRGHKLKAGDKLK